MENLNAEQVISEIDTKIKYAKFVNTDSVILSSKAAQFCLEHTQYYEQKIKELTEENERLRADVADLRDELECEKETNEHLCGEYMSAKADTVRKMQTLIEEKADSCNICLINSNKPIDIIYQISKKQLDQIAKEMLEGEK